MTVTPREIADATVAYRTALHRTVRSRGLGGYGELYDLQQAHATADALIDLLGRALGEATRRPPADEPEFYTVPELAARLRVSKMTVYRWVKEHPEHVVGLRHNIRIRASAVEHIVNES